MSDSQAAVAPGASSPPDNCGRTDAGLAPSPDSTSLYVGDLQLDATERQLMEMFGRVGPVASVRICRDSVSGASLGYAYINFVSPTDAISAMDTLNHTVVNGKPIILMWSRRDSDLRKSGIGNLFVKNLAESMDSIKLREKFSKFGKILSCKVVTTQEGKSKCYGYIQFDTQESANAAVEGLNESFIDGRQIFVSKFIKKSERISVNQDSNYTNLYVKNLDQDITEELLRLKFSDFGKITSLAIAMDPHGISRGFGFVNFESPSSAKNAVEVMNGLQLGSKTLYVARAQKKAERQQILGSLYRGSSDDSAKNMVPNVYIKNIHDSVTDHDLQEHFSSCGNITSARVMRGENGVSKGFGFVCFSSADEANKAVSSLHGVMFYGKPLYVAIAQRKEERMNYLRRQFEQRMAGMIQLSRLPQIPLQQQQQNLIIQQQQQQLQQPSYVPIPRATQQMRNLNVMRNQWKGLGQRNGAVIPAGGLPCSYYLPQVRSNSQQWSVKGDVAAYPASKIQDMDLFISFLASRPPDQQKQILGDSLFPVVQNQKPDLAAKITGMLLEMENRDLLRLLQFPNLLAVKVDEAEQVIRNFNTKWGKDDLDQASLVS